MLARLTRPVDLVLSWLMGLAPPTICCQAIAGAVSRASQVNVCPASSPRAASSSRNVTANRYAWLSSVAHSAVGSTRPVS